MNVTYFTDRDLGNSFPDILREAGLSVQRHRDHFAPDTPDVDWLQAVSRQGWVAVTHDGRIRYKPNELAAVKRFRVPLLVVVGKAPHRDLAHAFVATLPRIEQFLARHQPPFIAKVYRPSPSDTARRKQPVGRIERWFP